MKKLSVIICVFVALLSRDVLAQNSCIVGSVDTDGGARDIAVSGNYAFIADYTAGVGVFDISDPANPVIVGSVNAIDASGIAVSGNYAYIRGHVIDGGDGYSIMGVVDISDPANPVIVGSVDTYDYAQGIAVSVNYAYVADYAAGMKVVDISDPASPVIVGSVDAINVYSIAVSGNYAYVIDARGSTQEMGVSVIDISDPTVPVIVGSVDTGGGARDIAISGNYAYVANGQAGMSVIDISDPANPVIVGSVDSDSYAQGIAVSGNYAYVADYAAGMKVVDISDPAIPVIVGSIDTDGPALSVAVSGNYAYLADWYSGMAIIDIPCLTPVTSVAGDSPTVLMLCGNHPNPFNPQTTIAFEIPNQQDVTLRVFDLSGRLVRNLMVGESRTPGRHEVVWNGRDDSGRQVASGTYFYRLQAGEFAETKRMVLVK